VKCEKLLHNSYFKVHNWKGTPFGGPSSWGTLFSIGSFQQSCISRCYSIMGVRYYNEGTNL